MKNKYINKPEYYLNTTQSIIRKAITVLLGITTLTTVAADNGEQLNNSFRVNYAGYHPQAAKTAIYISEYNGPISWSLDGSSCQGSEDTFVAHDKSSGDSFYIVDFSHCNQAANNVQLKIYNNVSYPFDISDDPYGKLKYDFFNYFRDHETTETFSHSINDWTDLSYTFSYVKDAGDNGAYPTNTAEAAWALINILETYPEINDYYSSSLGKGRTVFYQLKILTEQFDHVLNNPSNLAIPKFHTNVASWAPCSPHPEGSSCISEPETKATYATARTLAALARLTAQYETKEQALTQYINAKQALSLADNQPFTCNQANKFGGEGGMYPDNDVWSSYRQPQKDRDNCYPDKNNTSDDEFSALAELYISAILFKQSVDIKNWRSRLITHEHFAKASSYWWGAVAMEGNLSLLTHEKTIDIDLSKFKQNLIDKSETILNNQSTSYPGVTWDPHSTQWNNGDLDLIDNNVRWGSHRMALNDARILTFAATLAKKRNNYIKAAEYARAAVKVLDHISGVNAMNLAMFTAKDYPNIENAVERTHDGADPKDLLSGKMVLGPNNWTNANDPNMPKFGSLPGLKMFALHGSGWSSREISIDANASLVPIAFYATEIAPRYYKLAPLK